MIGQCSGRYTVRLGVFRAHPYVEKVITLGSPHNGTPLADLAYSKGGGWLAQNSGQKSAIFFAKPV
ncbi:hypothetical protein ACEQPO_23880 [Bacillus sp. SL00103]